MYTTHDVERKRKKEKKKIEKENEVAHGTRARASEIGNGCFNFRAKRDIMREKKKRFVSYVPGKLSPPPVTNCRTKQKRKKSYLVKIQLVEKT